MTEPTQECSRCEELKPIAQFSLNEPGEIPWCEDCKGICRMCGTNDCDEDELEHGLCYSCCDHIDEEAED